MARDERAAGIAMSRVAIALPDDRLREGLVRVAEAGDVQLDDVAAGTGDSQLNSCLRRLPATGRPPMVSRHPLDLAVAERDGRRELIEGELQLQRWAAGAARHAGLAFLLGWMPSSERERVSTALWSLGGAVVELSRPRWVEPPTALPKTHMRGRFHLLLDAFGPIRYSDVDPTIFIAVTYVLMFGIMFADAGHGALVVLMGLAARLQRRPWLRSAWLLITACGLSAVAFGLLFGEIFGPSGLGAPLWLRPLDNPEVLLLAGVALGAVLLAASYVMGIVNRYREGGISTALFAASGIAGFAVFAGSGVAVIGLLSNQPLPLIGGSAIAAVGLALLVVGLRAGAGRGAGAAAEVVIGVLDTVVRVTANLISFTRLAAFGLVHAAIEGLVWSASAALFGRGWMTLLGVVVFLAGNAVAFSLEGLVVTIQALRLEYYELFSRLFVTQGRPFRPWRLDIVET